MVTSVAWDPRSNIVIGGVFTNFGAYTNVGVLTNIQQVLTNVGGVTNPGVTLSRVARLNYDGTRDTNFQQVSTLNGQVNAVAVQPDGRVLFGGAFTLPVKGVGRFRADGSLDASFAPGQGTDGVVNALTLLGDGRVYAGGAFSSYNLFPSVRVARLTYNASYDSDFAATSLMDGWVYGVACQSDGKVIVVGDFLQVGGVVQNRIVRLNPDGSVDGSFQSGAGANGTIYAVAVQSDDKILVGGDFTQFDHQNRIRFARLNADGSVDPMFQTGRGADNTVYAIALLPAGDIILGGAFTSVNGYPRNGVAKLYANFHPPHFDWVRVQGSSLIFQLSCVPGWNYVLQQTVDLKTWQPLSTNTAAGSVLTLTAPIPAGTNQLFFRALMQP